MALMNYIFENQRLVCPQGQALQVMTEQQELHCVDMPLVLTDMSFFPGEIDGAPSSAIVLALVGMMLAQGLHVADLIAN